MTKNLKINIILPFPVTKPVGGPKVLYEYANRFQQLGHEVKIFHSIERPYKKSKSPTWLKQLIFFLRGVARPKWFNLHPSISSEIVPAINNKYIPDADISLSTWWQMAYALNDLSPQKGKKINLIQGHEVWAGHDELVYKSYELPLHHVVIASYLAELFKEKTGRDAIHIPIAIDTGKFSLQKKIRERNNASIIMLHSDEYWKGTSIGMEALKLVKEKSPLLTAILFGVKPAPTGLPDWIIYRQRPENLPALYNEAGVFISPSLKEGWALPPAEAMACGCAVVCTDIGGHHDYAIEGETALLVEPGNVVALADSLLLLINDPVKRIELAERGHTLINKNFSWDESVNKMMALFYDPDKKQ